MPLSEGHVVIEHLRKEYVPVKSHCKTKNSEVLNNTAISKKIDSVLKLLDIPLLIQDCGLQRVSVSPQECSVSSGSLHVSLNPFSAILEKPVRWFLSSV